MDRRKSVKPTGYMDVTAAVFDAQRGGDRECLYPNVKSAQ